MCRWIGAKRTEIPSTFFHIFSQLPILLLKTRTAKNLWVFNIFSLECEKKSCHDNKLIGFRKNEGVNMGGLGRGGNTARGNKLFRSAPPSGSWRLPRQQTNWLGKVFIASPEHQTLSHTWIYGAVQRGWQIICGFLDEIVWRDWYLLSKRFCQLLFYILSVATLVTQHQFRFSEIFFL